MNFKLYDEGMALSYIYFTVKANKRLFHLDKHIKPISNLLYQSHSI